jgi:hypothetical protein
MCTSKRFALAWNGCTSLRNITDMGRLRDLIPHTLQVEPQVVMQVAEFGSGFLRYLMGKSDRGLSVRH